MPPLGIFPQFRSTFQINLKVFGVLGGNIADEIIPEKGFEFILNVPPFPQGCGFYIGPLGNIAFNPSRYRPAVFGLGFYQPQRFQPPDNTFILDFVQPFFNRLGQGGTQQQIFNIVLCRLCLFHVCRTQKDFRPGLVFTGGQLNIVSYPIFGLFESDICHNPTLSFV